MTATLYIVATPIGNLDDISQRAVSILQQVDYIFAEDTRHSARLLQHCAINTPVQAYHDFSSMTQTERIIELLLAGKAIALISDAGTPLISDPGYRLVKKAHEENIKVVPIPGACAAISALCVSGLPTDRFSFEGFLPAKKQARIQTLQALAQEPRTMVFYEAPHRIKECLADFCEVFGDERKVVLARELTKTFETIRQLPLSLMQQWVADDNHQQKGEIVLVLEGYISQVEETLSMPAQQLVALLMEDLAPNKVSKIVAQHYALPKKMVYEYILSLKN